MTEPKRIHVKLSFDMASPLRVHTDLSMFAQSPAKKSPDRKKIAILRSLSTEFTLDMNSFQQFTEEEKKIE